MNKESANRICKYLCECGQHDTEKFKLGDTIRYTPTEVAKLLEKMPEPKNNIDENKTFIIINARDNSADSRLHRLLRTTGTSFLTGYYEDYVSPACIWYITDRPISFGTLNLGMLLGNAKYKALNLDGCFECNCSDSDLPWIEDVWEEVNRELTYETKF